MAQAIYKGKRTNWSPGIDLPAISTDLDSVRAYQFEVHFDSTMTNRAENLTLAAKQVSQVGMSVEDIVIDRVNDRVYYPGKPTPEEITITFDNLIKDEPSAELWSIFQNTYDPITGTLSAKAPPAGSGQFKAQTMTIYQLTNDQSLRGFIQCHGVWMKSWKAAEFNYSTNEFHTIEATFRYDFMGVADKSGLIL